LVVKFELHVLIVKHLPKYGALEQVDKAEGPFTKLYLQSIHLDFLLDLANDLLEAVFPRSHTHLVHLVPVEVADVHHLYLDGLLLADLHGFVGYGHERLAIFSDLSVAAVDTNLSRLDANIEASLI